MRRRLERGWLKRTMADARRTVNSWTGFRKERAEAVRRDVREHQAMVRAKRAWNVRVPEDRRAEVDG